MEIVIKGTSKEIAALVAELQGRRSTEPAFVPMDSGGVHLCAADVTPEASSADSRTPSCLDTSTHAL